MWTLAQSLGLTRSDRSNSSCPENKLVGDALCCEATKIAHTQHPEYTISIACPLRHVLRFCATTIKEVLWTSRAWLQNAVTFSKYCLQHLRPGLVWTSIIYGQRYPGPHATTLHQPKPAFLFAFYPLGKLWWLAFKTKKTRTDLIAWLPGE